MIREMVKIDEELCDGCGDCVPGCHEGALQIIDGKARLISDLMCDGLGACLGHCPQGAITIEKREAEPYDEVKVMEIMTPKGRNTVYAHLTHLLDHNETEFLEQAYNYLLENAKSIDFDVQKLINDVKNSTMDNSESSHGCGCPGAKEMSFAPVGMAKEDSMVSGKSALQQWPVQMHLVSPNAPYFRNADVLIAADCVAFSMGNFHQDYLQGKALAIACPKLDDGMDIYENKIVAMIDEAKLNTITVMIMQVPCCGGLLQLVKSAAAKAERKVPVKAIVVGLQGEVLQEEWV